MGKLALYESIEKEKVYNLETLLSKSELCFKICRITSVDLSFGNTRKEEIKAKVKEYANNSKNMSSNNSQSGRVWFLVKENKEYSEVLQVAQALDYNSSPTKGYFYEIISHIDEMFEEMKDNKYKTFANNIKKGDSLVFYELAIDKYLEEFAPKNYKQIIYELACDYYAEASLAHFTQAKEWGYYNSGMDKRAYYNILDTLKQCVRIDAQNEVKFWKNSNFDYMD